MLSASNRLQLLVVYTSNEAEIVELLGDQTVSLQVFSYKQRLLFH